MNPSGLLARRAPEVPEPPRSGAVVLEARGLTVAYGERTVLDGVDVAARAGRLLALIGPNGAGKSTLLAALAGDLEPDAGTVTVAGQPYSRWAADELALRRGVLLQQVGVSFPFTVTQIVRMGRAPWAGTAAEDWDDEVIAAAMVETEVDRFAERVYGSLSGGERARAALARVLAQEPIALLLDEPTAALDIRHQELALEIARSRAARGDAVVVVMHDLGSTAAYADEVLVLSRGRIRAEGPPAEVLTSDLLSEVYEHPIEVFPHPETGVPLILPRRSSAPPPASRPHPQGARS